MAKTAARPGRKPIPAAQGQRMSLGLKVTPEIKNKLDAAARENGRTQSQEAEARIERTFDQDDAIAAVLDYRFGPKTAAVIEILAKVIERAELDAAWVCHRGGDWLHDPYIFDQVNQAVRLTLETLRPPGDPEHPGFTEAEIRDDWGGSPPVGIVGTMWRLAATSVLGAVTDRQDMALFLRDWARPIAEKLGSEIVERIRKAERPQ